MRLRQRRAGDRASRGWPGAPPPVALLHRRVGLPQWSADGRTVYHISEDSGRVAAVVAVPVSGAPPRVVVRFDDPTRPWHRYGFRVRGQQIYFTLGDLQSDIWVTEVGRE